METVETEYPCVNHPDRIGWVDVEGVFLCRECYYELRNPKLLEMLKNSGSGWISVAGPKK